MGENTSLSCGVSGTDNLLAPTLTYIWERDSVTISEAVEATLKLGPLRTNDSGNYSCRVTVSDSFLTNYSIKLSSELVTIKVIGKLYDNFTVSN